MLLSAFGGDDELTLVNQLRADADDAIGLVAESQRQVIGHILFSPASIDHAPAGLTVLTLAPLAVHSDYQRAGVGRRLTEAGIGRCRRAGADLIVVVGHPHYYRRFGFVSAAAHGLNEPFGAGEAFLALALRKGVLDEVSGMVRFAPAFNRFEPGQ